MTPATSTAASQEARESRVSVAGYFEHTDQEETHY
jgi:hypothetical protein